MILGNIEEQAELKTYLEPNERLIWVGKPKAGIIFTWFDIFLIPFSILWGGFAIAWEVIAVMSDAPWFFLLFGAPFVLVGLYMMVGRFYYDAIRRKNTLYAITPHRIIFVSGSKEKKVSVISINDLQSFYFSQKKDGSGTIFLVPANINPIKLLHRRSKTMPSLEMIADAENVYNKLVSLKKAISK